MPHEQDDRSFPSKSSKGRCIPVACRVVPMDQWFTTHIDQSWYVQDLKIWLLSKALPAGVLNLPASYRPSSPVLFASTSTSKPGTHNASASSDDKEKDDFDSDVLSISTADVFDASFTHYIPNTNLNAESAVKNASGFQAIAPYSYKRGEFTSSEKVSDPNLLSKMIALSRRWQVYSFSTGMLLSEEVPLTEYRLCPHYLFELHRTGDYIPLSRQLPDDFWNPILPAYGNSSSNSSSEVSTWSYQQPYFDTWTWIFTALHVDKISSSTKDVVAADLKQQVGNSSGGWKKTWVVVRDGCLVLYHEKSDLGPIGKFDLADCTGLCGEDKVRPIMYSHFHGIDNIVLGVVGHWKQETRSQPPKSRTIKFTICIRFRRQYSVKQNSLIYTLLYQNSSWLLVDFPDKATYEHFLRVLHRLIYFNPTLVSDNLPPHLYPRRTLHTDFLPNPIRPPQPLRFARASSPVSTIIDDGDSFSSKTTMGSQVVLGNNFGVMFPEWREKVLRQSMISTHGSSFEGMLWSKLTKVVHDGDHLDDDDDFGYDSDRSNEPSELEWTGWAYDLDRPKPTNPLPSSRSSHRNSVDLDDFPEESASYASSPRNRTQSVFTLTISSSITQETTLDVPTSVVGVVGRSRSSTVSLKKPSFTSPKHDTLALPTVAESSSTSRFIKALGGKGSNSGK